MGHELVALFGGDIQAYGVVHAVVGAEGHFLVAAIHADGAGIDQVLHGMVSAGLQDVVEPYDVDLSLHIGVLNAIAHAGLCSQIDQNVKLMLPE